MTNTSRLSRRNFLKGAGAGLAVGLAGTHTAPALAQVTGASSGDVFGLYRFTVGDFQITAIKDNFSSMDPAIFGTEEQAADVQAELEASNVPADGLMNTFNVMMIQSGDDVFLVDSGPGGALVPTMELLGMTPADVTGVLGSHWHPDHIGGLLTDGAISFPNAMYYLSQTEYDFVQANAEGFTGGAAAAITPYADSDRLTLYNSDDEIVPGVQAIAAPGHTPGHHAMMMSSNGNQIMHLVDTAINVYVHVANPSLSIQFDADAATAVETRVALLSRAADEQIPVIGYHFPFPGVGYIARDGESGFRFVPFN